MKKNSYIGQKSLLFLVTLGVVFSNFAWSQCNGLPYNQYYYDYDGDGYGTSSVFSGGTSEDYGSGQYLTWQPLTVNLATPVAYLSSFAFSVNNIIGLSQCTFQFYNGPNLVATEYAYPSNGAGVNSSHTFTTPLLDITSVVVYSYWNPSFLNDLTLTSIPSSIDACAQPSGYASNNSDCYDFNASINPMAIDVCNSIDDNCDTQIDNATYYADTDGDGYGSVTTTILEQGNADVSFQNGNIVIVGSNTGVETPFLESRITYTSLVNQVITFDWSYNTDDELSYDPAFYFINGVQFALSANAGQAQQNGSLTLSVSAGQTIAFAVISEDNVAGAATLIISSLNGAFVGQATACSAPSGYVANNDDCNDSNGSIHPGATELCNNIDDDCNGSIETYQYYYSDTDNDGYGNATNTKLTQGNSSIVINQDGIVIQGSDSYSNEVNVSSSITFTSTSNQTVSFNWSYSTLDNSADYDVAYYLINNQQFPLSNNAGANQQNGQISFSVNNGDTFGFSVISDDDGYGAATLTVANLNAQIAGQMYSCTQPVGYASNNFDCNGGDGNIFPGQAESCNGADDNCSGQIDEGVLNAYYSDTDGDGFGSLNATVIAQGNSSVSYQPAGLTLIGSTGNNAQESVAISWVVPTSGTYNFVYNYFTPANNTATDVVSYSINGVVQEDIVISTGGNIDFTESALIGVQAGQVFGLTLSSIGNLGTSSTFQVSFFEEGMLHAGRVEACSAPIGFSLNNNDCQPTNSAINPGATEVCNGVDDNCSGQIDEGVLIPFYADTDGDGFGSGVSNLACTAPNGYVTNNSDCNDSDASINPNTQWYGDLDGDGYSSLVVSSCTSPGANYSLSGVMGDCNDGNSAINPASAESCNDIDDNCDTQIDEGVLVQNYFDEDGDGFGAALVASIPSCSQLSGYVNNNSDCDDGSSAINPAVVEVCNNIDDNCDTQIDEGLVNFYYSDLDQDGFGSDGVTESFAPGAWILYTPTTFVLVGTPEQWYGVSNSIQFVAPITETYTFNWAYAVLADPNQDPGYYFINDQVVQLSNDWGENYQSGYVSVSLNAGDTFGFGINSLDDEAGPVWLEISNFSARSYIGVTPSCTQPVGYVLSNDDCDNANPAINPGEVEICNSIDENCDSEIDEGVLNVYYADADGDGFGEQNPSYACNLTNGFVNNNTDCDDASISAFPGSVEQCNSADDDCDGLIDENAVPEAIQIISCGPFTWNETGLTYTTSGTYYEKASSFNSLSSFNNAVNGLGYSLTATEDFENVSGFATSITDDFGPGSPTWTASSSYYVFTYGFNGSQALETNSLSTPISFTFSPGVRAVGGNFFISNNTNTGVLNHPVNFTLSDGTYVSVNVSSASDFNGFVSNGALIEGITIGATSAWGNVRIDNLVVATGTQNFTCSHPPLELTINTPVTFYADADGDGYGDLAVTESACTAPIGYVSDSTDCDDAENLWYPGAAELCNGFDDDCDGLIDEVLSTFYADADADGFGDAGTSIQSCSAPNGYVIDNTDCNDNNPAINPTTLWYLDLDGDSYGNELVSAVGCSAPLGYVANSSDCDDNSSSINPTSIWYYDNDGDGFGNTQLTQVTCIQPTGYVSINNDCNDNSNGVYPTAMEICNSIDEDCDGEVNEGLSAQVTNVTSCGSYTWSENGAIYNNSGTYYANTSSATVYNSLINFTNASSANGYQLSETEDFSSYSGYMASATGDLGIGFPTWTATQTQGQYPSIYATSAGGSQTIGGNAYASPVSIQFSSGVTGVGGNFFVSGLFGVVLNATVNISLSDGTAVSLTIGSASTFTGFTTNGLLIQSITINTPFVNGPTNPYVRIDNLVVTTGTPVLPCGVDVLNLTINTPSSFYADVDGDGYGAGTATSACAQPSGYVSTNTDCNNNNSAVNPAATEICNSIDDNCDTQTDEALTFTNYYSDLDGDGFGAGAATNACAQPAGYVTTSNDCNDNNVSVNPASTEVCNNADDDCDAQIDEGVQNNYYVDTDGDGFGAGTATTACTQPIGYVTTNTDCDDVDTNVNPAATEICNSIDDDCDTQIDEGVQTTYYLDEDGDGFGNAVYTASACTLPAGYVVDNTDCDDDIASVNVLATEVCNDLDDDCDNQIDEGLQTTYYEDEDGDGYGNVIYPESACVQPFGFVLTNTDCNDSNVGINPAATEICNGIDDDCDTQIDEGLTSTNYYADIDGDGYGAGAATNACAQPLGYVTSSNDCDDNNALINSTATEICGNNIDEDCDGIVTPCIIPGCVDPTACNFNPAANVADGSCTLPSVWYADEDGDGYGDSNNSLLDCDAPAWAVSNGLDCNDVNDAVNIDAVEVCNSMDDDCDNDIDEGLLNTYYADLDGDGFGVGSASNASTIFAPGTSTVSVQGNQITITGSNGDSDMTLFTLYSMTSTADQTVTFDWQYSTEDESPEYDPAFYLVNGAPQNLSELTGAIIQSGQVQVTLVAGDILQFLVATEDDALGAATLVISNLTGSFSTAINACSQPVGYVTMNTDCNDGSSAIYPSAVEVCGNNIDEDCSGADLVCPANTINPVNIVSIGNYGTGTQTSINVNLSTGSDNIESAGSGLDKWYQFTAQSNAVRVALTGNALLDDDNDVALYDYTPSAGSPLIPLKLENDVAPNAMGISADAGNEILYYDQLNVGSVYWICIRNLNSIAGIVNMKISYLGGSSMDIGPYTNYTNVYNNTCQNFKCKFKSGASYYTFNLWNGNSALDNPSWVYSTAPASTSVASTVVQLGKLVGANLGLAQIEHSVKIDAHYALKDAFGNVELVTGFGTVTGVFGLNPETDLNLRTSDRCPVYKSPTFGSLATNRSICGTSRYIWELTMSLPSSGLPQVIQGPFGGSRLIGVPSIAGIANGQLYDVRISSLHSNQVDQTDFGSTQCMRTYGFAGSPMLPIEAQENTFGNGVVVSIYPNPNNGQKVNFNINGMDGSLNLKVTDATGREVYNNRYLVEGSMNTTLDFGQALADGMYMVEMLQNGELKTMRMVVSK